MKLPEIEINNSACDPFLIFCGKVVMNFGTAELLTFNWLEKLEGKEEPANFTLLFRKRIQKIRNLVKNYAFCSNDIKGECCEAWECLESYCDFRNQIVHSPIGSNETTGAFGIIDYRSRYDVKSKTLSPKGKIIPDLQTYGKCLDEVNKIIIRLHELHKNIWG